MKELKINDIYEGNCIEVLKTMPDESINCVMTSPPYWALRDYGIKEDIIWDGDNTCKHNWEKDLPFAGQVSRNKDLTTGFQNKAKICSNGQIPTSNNKPTSGNFCSKCNAWKGQLGLEPIFDLYIKHLCDIFDEVKRVLRKDGTCWVNLGDSYGSGKGEKGIITEGLENKKKVKGFEKSLLNIPARFSIEMMNRGWILRNTIIWHKPNCMPSSVKDRFTVDFEYLFFFVKNKSYWFETQYEPIAISTLERGKYHIGNNYKNKGIENKTVQGLGKLVFNKDSPGNRNKRTVWSITTHPFKEAHFATYPEELCYTPIKAGCPEFVCNKCKKIRETIWLTHVPKRSNGTSKQKEYVRLGNRTGGAATFNPLWRKLKDELPIDKIIGYTDCKCNAGLSPGIVLDPFFGAGTTGLVALKQNKSFIGIELNQEYIEIANKRLSKYIKQSNLNKYVGEH